LSWIRVHGSESNLVAVEIHHIIYLPEERIAQDERECSFASVQTVDVEKANAFREGLIECCKQQWGRFHDD
jgi:hypothetical protein